MKPAPMDPADLVHRIRQQLILAQVRIMELEDTRDELTPKLTETEKLLAAAQTLANAKLDEAAHLETVRAELQAQFEHMRHIQHVTNEALNTSRTEETAHLARIDQLRAELASFTALSQRLAAADSRNLQCIAQLDLEIHALRDEATTRLARLTQLETELRAMKSSRSWRLTAWLRSLERMLGRRTQ